MKVGYSYLQEQFNVEKTRVKVKYIDLPWQAHTEDMLSAIKELLLKTGQLTLGPKVNNVRLTNQA